MLAFLKKLGIKRTTCATNLKWMIASGVLLCVYLAAVNGGVL